MNSGKEFENQIRDSIKKLDYVYYLRLQDPPQSFNQNANNGLRFSNKNPFDFLMYVYPYLYCIENKSKATNSLSFNIEKVRKSTDIKYHQIVGLWDAYVKGAISGFLFNFRTDEETYFLHIYDFIQFAKDTTKKSINKKDVVAYGGVIIPQSKKIVKYDYDIRFLLDWCKLNYSHYEKLIPLADEKMFFM